MSNQRLPICFVCGRNKKSVILTIDKYKLFSCNECKLLSLLPQKPSENRTYKSTLKMDSYISYMKPLRLGHYDKEIKQIRNYKNNRKRNKLLDIGCALGWFINLANQSGFQADGLEPQKDLAKKAKQDNPISRIYTGSLNTFKQPKYKYDVVTLWSVFEHFTDPDEALQKVRHLLTENGIVAIRTPNNSGLAIRTAIFLYKISSGSIRIPIEASLQLNFSSKHWMIFSPKNLSVLLKKRGFQIIKTYYSTSVDWKHLDLWFQSRKMQVSLLMRVIYQFYFFINEVVSNFTLADDFVVIAKKMI